MASGDRQKTPLLAQFPITRACYGEISRSHVFGSPSFLVPMFSGSMLSWRCETLHPDRCVDRCSARLSKTCKMAAVLRGFTFCRLSQMHSAPRGGGGHSRRGIEVPVHRLRHAVSHSAAAQRWQGQTCRAARGQTASGQRSRSACSQNGQSRRHSRPSRYVFAAWPKGVGRASRGWGGPGFVLGRSFDRGSITA